jgi:hypothetical protein
VNTPKDMFMRRNSYMLNNIHLPASSLLPDFGRITIGSSDTSMVGEILKVHKMRAIVRGFVIRDP